MKRKASSVWIFAAIIASTLLAVAAYVVGRDAGNVEIAPVAARTSAARVQTPVGPFPAPSPTASPTPPVRDLSEALALSDAATCTFSPSADRAFKAMLEIDRNTGRPLPLKPVVLSDLQLTPKPEVRNADDVVEGGRIYVSEVRLPEASLWNGLRLGRLMAEYGNFPETDDYETRAITFREEPARVRAAMARLGVNVPERGYTELDDGGCGGAMEVKPFAGGTILSCSRGC